jgi:iron(III) transport system ATP-binding protein
VAVARTIAIEPKVLLLDEPLSNLDAKLRVHMRAELLALQRKLGITTIFVTHDQEEALSISDRVAVLDGGVIQQVGTPMDLYDRPANRYIANFVGTINMLRGRLKQGSGGVMFQSPVIGTITIRGATGDGDADLAIRPHALLLARAGAAADPARVWVEGRVSGREFLGEFVRYVVAVNGVEITADEPHFGDGVIYAPGDSVRIGIDPARVKLFPV